MDNRHRASAPAPCHSPACFKAETRNPKSRTNSNDPQSSVQNKNKLRVEKRLPIPAILFLIQGCSGIVFPVTFSNSPPFNSPPFNSPTLQLPNPPTLQPSNSPTLQLSNSPTLQLYFLHIPHTMRHSTCGNGPDNSPRYMVRNSMSGTREVVRTIPPSIFSKPA